MNVCMLVFFSILKFKIKLNSEVNNNKNVVENNEFFFLQKLKHNNNNIRLKSAQNVLFTEFRRRKTLYDKPNDDS